MCSLENENTESRTTANYKWEQERERVIEKSSCSSRVGEAGKASETSARTRVAEGSWTRGCKVPSDAKTKRTTKEREREREREKIGNEAWRKGRGRRKWTLHWQQSLPWSVRQERFSRARGERKPIRSRWEQMTTRALHVEGPSSGYRE